MLDDIQTSDTTAPTLVWCDASIVVVDKPAGQLSVPGRGDDKLDCTWSRVRDRWPDALVVHRLDQATSGLLLFARCAAAQRRLSRAFAERQVVKGYVAVVSGLVQDDSGRFELPMASDWPRRPRQRVDREAGKPALTEWRVVQRDPSSQRTRLALRPVTGRTHQLRVHLAAIGHAIVGDTLYIDGLEPHEPRMLLHASELQLAHPHDGAPLQLQSQPAF